MNNFKYRKLFLLSFLFILLFSIYVLLPFLRGYVILISFLLAASCIFAGGVFFEKIRFRSAIFILLSLLTAFSSVMYARSFTSENEYVLKYTDGSVYEVKGKITEVSHIGTYSSSYIVDILEIDGEISDFSASLEIEKITFFEYGDVISFNAVFEEAKDDSLYLRGKSIFLTASSEDASFTEKSKKDISYYIHTANEYLCERTVDILGRDAGGFCSALVLGNRAYVSSGIRLDFSRIGISHILALSGLHLSILSQTLDFLLRGFLKKKYRNIVLMISCIAFAFFTGLSASVIRAAIMLCAIFIADIAGEENDSLTSLFAAGALIILFDPASVYDVGFWLSVSATLGIILVRPAAYSLFYKWQKPRKNKAMRALYVICQYFYGILSMSLAAFFFTLPITYFAFGEVSVIGILSNLIFLPLVTVLLVLCIFFIPFSYVPYASGVFSFLCKNLAEFMLSAAHSISEGEFVSVSLKYPFSPYIFAVLGVCLFDCIFIKKLSLVKIGAIVLSFALAFTACFTVYSYKTDGNVNLFAYTSKSGEFISFRSGNENYVIDVSTGKYSHLYEAILSVKEFSSTEVDNLVLTHYHQHHGNALYRLSDVIKIRNVLLPKPETEKETEYFDEICAILEKQEISYTVYTRGSTYEKDGVTLDFAPLYKLPRSEKPVVAFKISTPSGSLSYIESAAFEGKSDLQEYLFADVIFVGSHGPDRKFGSSASLLGDAQHVIFANGCEAWFRKSNSLSNAYYLAAEQDALKILYTEE